MWVCWGVRGGGWVGRGGGVVVCFKFRVQRVQGLGFAVWGLGFGT